MLWASHGRVWFRIPRGLFGVIGLIDPQCFVFGDLWRDPSCCDVDVDEECLCREFYVNTRQKLYNAWPIIIAYDSVRSSYRLPLWGTARMMMASPESRVNSDLELLESCAGNGTDIDDNKSHESTPVFLRRHLQTYSRIKAGMSSSWPCWTFGPGELVGQRCTSTGTT